MFSCKNQAYFYFFSGFFLALLLAGSFFLGILTNLRPPVVVVQQQTPPGGSRPAADTPTDPAVSPENQAAESSSPNLQDLSPNERFAKEFESFLNNFIKDLHKETSEYKKDRRILKAVADPYNLNGTENAEKSYKTFRDDIAPMLRKKGQQIVNIFPKSDKVVDALLADKPEDVKKDLLSTWEDMKKDQMNSLVDYFEKEDQLIQAYEKLLKFYFVHSKLYSLNVETGNLVFRNKKYQKEADQILDEIQALRDEQKKH